MGPLVGALGAGLLLLPTLAHGQTTTQHAPRALTAPEPPGVPLVHPADLPQANAREMADGQPLRAQQVPRFLRPTHDSSFGFNDFLVLGDHRTVTFTRWDPEDEQGASETWHRATTREVGGRLASVFHPRWPANLLRRVLPFQRWGVDRPFIYWGRLGIPGTTREFGVRLSIVPPNIPESPVVRINDAVQFASHVVNIRDPDFGDSRVQGGDQEFNFPEITGRFYEHFADEYEVIAVVSDAMQFGGTYFHRNVRNDISGIGLPLFDRSADFGSEGVLQAVEGDGGDGVWASWFHVLHEQGHQYGEHSKVWDSLRPPLDRRGLAPSSHTPLLFPGAVMYGAVLFGDRRVTRIRSAGQPDRFEIEPTLPLVTYHPLTLYRMGLVPATAVPDVLVFRDQGQFGGVHNVSPAPGTAVTGQTTAVTVNDLIAADGVRRGPAVRRIRRATIFVSREALVSKTQMDVLNYFARRLGASSGVTSWDRYPSFAEATGGRATMTTNIRPLRRQAAPPSGAEAGCAKVGTRALVGFTLDQEVGGCLTTGDTLRVSGRLTLADRDDYNRVCLRFRRYPDTEPEDRVNQCASLDGDNRFALEVTFPVGRAGGYELLTYAYWPSSGRALSRYTGAIELRPDHQTNRPPVAASTLPDLVLTLPGTLDVDVSRAFADPDRDVLTYAVSSFAPQVVTVSATGTPATLTAVSAGTATVQVTATDPGGLSATQSFTATVTVTTVGARFTDDPLRPGVTPVRAIHFTELRARIDALREAAGLGRYRWTDPVLRAGVTPVRLVHLTELRTALESAYEAAGRPIRRWTDPAPVQGRTPIRTVHVTELRAAVTALD